MQILSNTTAAAVLAGAATLLSLQAQDSTTTLSAGLVPAITLNGGPIGSVHLVQSSTNVADPNGWTTIGAVRLFTPNQVYCDATATNSVKRFYRTQFFGLLDTNMVWIPPGTFTMGSPDTEEGRDPSEGPQTLVTLTHGFFIGRFEVRDADWLAYMTKLPDGVTNDLSLPNYAQMPVRKLYWVDATNYCAVRTAAEAALGKIPPGWAYRLPTEAEWEYACRAGTTTPFALGNTLRNDSFEQDAWFDGRQPYPTNTIPSAPIVPNGADVVGRFAPNGFGLYDVAGNVGEYCLDTFATHNGNQPPTGYPGGSVTNPPPPMGGSWAIVRGGNAASPAKECRSASRWGRFTSSAQGGTSSYIGFRVVLSPISY